MDKKVTADASYRHNMLEFGDFIAAMSLDEFINWIYRIYNVPAEEAVSIDECYACVEERWKE